MSQYLKRTQILFPWMNDKHQYRSIPVSNLEQTQHNTIRDTLKATLLGNRYSLLNTFNIHYLECLEDLLSTGDS